MNSAGKVRSARGSRRPDDAVPFGRARPRAV